MTVVPSGTGAGAPIRVDGMRDKYVQFVGLAAAGATVTVEGSNDPNTASPSNWATLVAAQTADGFVSIPQTAQWIRINRTVAGSGAVIANLAYLDGRSDG